MAIELGNINTMIRLSLYFLNLYFDEKIKKLKFYLYK